MPPRPEATLLVSSTLAVVFVTPRDSDALTRENIDVALEAYTAMDEPRPTELVLVTKSTVPSHIARRISAWLRQVCTGDDDLPRTQVCVRVLREAQLHFNPLRREDGALWYRKVPKEQEGALLAALHVKTKNELPKFSGSDPVVAFMGFETDCIVEYEVLSETAGVARCFRVVTKDGTVT